MRAASGGNLVFWTNVSTITYFCVETFHLSESIIIIKMSNNVKPKRNRSLCILMLGLAGIAGGFRDEEGIGKVAVPSGYADFTIVSWQGSTAEGWELDLEADWMYGPTAATLELGSC